MICRFKNWLRAKYDQQIDATGVALFRIMYAIVLFMEVSRMEDFKELIFDAVPFLYRSDVHLSSGFFIWKISIFLLIIGLFSRTAAIVNFLFSVVFIGFIKDFEYHVFYAYMGLNFLIMFIPVSRVLSLDRLILKLKYSNSKFHFVPKKTTSVMSYWLPIYLGVALVYFDSIFFKLSDPVWLKGLGLWWPASHVVASYIMLPKILDQQWLMIFLGYLTIVFELVFIFLFYFKKMRWPLWLIGMGLHLGILIFFPIPFFALTVVALYFLLIPVGSYRIFDVFKFKSPRATFYYDGECPLCARTKIVLEHFDVFNSVEFVTVQSAHVKDPRISNIELQILLDDIHAVDKNGKLYKGFGTYVAIAKANILLWPFFIIFNLPGVTWLGNKIYFLISRNRITERCTDEACGIEYIQVPKGDAEIKLLKNLNLRDLKFYSLVLFLLTATIIQCIFIVTAHPVQNTLHQSIKDSKINAALLNYKERMHPITKGLLGMTHHAVFGHYHFAQFDDILKVEFIDKSGNKQLLPITEPDGRPGEYVRGASWVNWNFRVLGSKVNHEKLLDGLKRYTAFWLGRNFRGNFNGEFLVSTKSMNVPLEWRAGVLEHDVLENNWQAIGKIKWGDGVFIGEIEKLD